MTTLTEIVKTILSEKPGLNGPQLMQRITLDINERLAETIRELELNGEIEFKKDPLAFGHKESGWVLNA